MNIASFKKKMKRYFKIYQVYPKIIKEKKGFFQKGLSFFSEIKTKVVHAIDKTNVYKFSKYYAIFKENTLKCVVKSSFYVEGKNDCEEYSMKAKLQLH
jgi:hypothetical protein